VRETITVGVLALSVMVTALAIAPSSPAAADGPARGRERALARQVREVRDLQERLEETLRDRDRLITRLERDRADLHEGLRASRARLRDVRTVHRESRRRAERLEGRLERTRAERARVGIRLASAKRPGRLRVRLAISRTRLTQVAHRLRAERRRLERRADHAANALDRLERRKRELERRIERKHDRLGTVAWRRSRTEWRLADRIGAMVPLARQLAAERSDARPGRGRSRLARPVRKGHVSQRYGCTGFRLEPRRGRCRGFHDGIDYAAPAGTRVRASATGVVAYVGWSPHDTGDRAFIVVIAHAGGLTTRYAHLRPERKVRAGRFVRKGQVIGLVGNTGRSTGPHLHLEVVRRSRTVNPRALMSGQRDEPRRRDRHGHRR
jgi:murein DD-endopeptidase MepM/ murein hydrolase activator NlpD